MFRPCSTNVATVLDLCFNFLDQSWVFFEFFDLCFDFLDLCLDQKWVYFDIFGQNLECFDCAGICFDYLDLLFNFLPVIWFAPTLCST